MHYPLPLEYQEEVDMPSMFRTFQRLQSQMMMNKSQAGFASSELNGLGGHAQETQSEYVQGGMNKYNTVQNFFQIETENESLRDQLQEVQSSFTRNDHEYLELA